MKRCKPSIVILLSLMLLMSLFIACQNKDSKEYSIGKLDTIYSDILQEDRDIYIRVPDGFYGMDEHDRAFPVMYVIDGMSLFVPTVGVIDQMTSAFTANDRCPDMIIVGIPNTNRNRDLSPISENTDEESTSTEFNGGAHNFAKFIAEELIPHIENNYPTVPHRSLIGHSLGGLFNLHCLADYSHLFDTYICLDPALEANDGQYVKYAVDKLSKVKYDKKSMYLAFANSVQTKMSREEIIKDTSSMMNYMSTGLAFEDTLLKMKIPGLQVKSKYYENENHWSVPLPGIIDGIKFLYGDHHFPEMLKYYDLDTLNDPNILITELENHFNGLSDKYNYNVRPKESYIQAWAFGFLDLGKPKLTKALVEYNINNYPSSPSAINAMGEYFLRQQDSIQALQYYKKSMKLEKTERAQEMIATLQ